MRMRRVGKRIAISPARAMVMELLHHAQKVPSLPLAKTVNISLLLEARRFAGISWAAIFLKAYSLVAREIPDLRRAYIPYPWGHYYEHPDSVATVLVEREVGDENAVLGGRIRQPDCYPLTTLDEMLRSFRDSPVEEINVFRQSLRLGRFPGFLRRFIFWHSLYLSGFWRAKRFGTFMVSSLGNFGVEQIHPRTFLTTYLTYGPIDSHGDVDVKIIYDHRVLDGRTVARALVSLEETLNGPILSEIRECSLRPQEALVA